MEIRRNIVLSLKDYLESYLTSNNYTFAFVTKWTGDKDIVLPKDYADPNTQIRLPAGKIHIGNRRQGALVEIGGDSKYNHFLIQLMVHGETEGQLYDLLDMFENKLEDQPLIDILDYSSTGYPAQSTPPKIYDLEVSQVVTRDNPNLGEENVALSNAGLVTCLGELIRSTDNG